MRAFFQVSSSLLLLTLVSLLFFKAKFANEYLPNLMRVYLTLNSGHHCSSVYNTMVESVVDLPQFSRWIRESREGQKLAFTLIPLLALIPIAERGGEGWSPEKVSPAEQLATRASFPFLLALAYRRVCSASSVVGLISGPRTSVQSLLPNVQGPVLEHLLLSSRPHHLFRLSRRSTRRNPSSRSLFSSLRYNQGRDQTLSRVGQGIRPE